MPIVCDGCGEYVETKVNRDERTRVCPECEYAEPIRMVPLFIVTGTSGAGKTTVAKHLRKALPDCDVFDTDEMHAADWDQARSNWLKVAFQIGQSGRHAVLCGTQMPRDVERCDHYRFFREVHYLNLHCDDLAREARLRGRPAWRGTTDAFVEDHKNFARWLLDNGETAFDPPLVTVDTTGRTPEQAAGLIRDWVLARI
ncbi:hypothetical protein SAMN02799624_05532 [Paenibacillus sp. UNC496MF]|uniref:AAA family ATPase n=1 Tax=Paenibacillus sp. UNC496MF TaxID=1502753 RepID=UPI0008F19C6A|nr:AAA family ATPase [Paenibacillus sp. UNC496MF]SFJ69400.1 hypothetical protein SAMN02799624_05532 [Paenibacillus sp. UNC496MF]